MEEQPPSRPVQPGRSIAWEMALIGFAMAGFFDGILLHQVLQWHHLLSLVPGDAFRDPRVQIAADGAFHLLMYLLLGVGLLLLWRCRRRTFARPAAAVFGAFLLGFGAWQAVDAVVFHWLLRLHHIRVDTGAPIAWDVGWLALLGLLPLLIGWRLVQGGEPPASGRRTVLPAVLAIVTVGAGLQALRAPEGANAVVLFAPGVSQGWVMAALADADARLVEIGVDGDIAVIAFDRPGRAWRLYRHGALLVGSAGPAGCAAAIAPTRPA